MLSSRQRSIASRGGGDSRGKTPGPVKILLLQNNIQNSVSWLFEICINMEQSEDCIMEYQCFIRVLN